MDFVSTVKHKNRYLTVFRFILKIVRIDLLILQICIKTEVRYTHTYIHACYICVFWVRVLHIIVNWIIDYRNHYFRYNPSPFAPISTMYCLGSYNPSPTALISVILYCTNALLLEIWLV